MRKVALGKATGKIILMGEHAVVFGEPALALPFLAVQVESVVTEKEGDLSVNCSFYDGLVHDMPKIYESLKHAIRFSLYRLGVSQNPPIHVEITSSIPAERGMGSSAAVAVAIARSLFNFYSSDLTSKELWEIVQSSETIAHGNPSGVDAITTSDAQPVFYIKNQPIEGIALDLSAYLVVADTGQIGHTLEAVQHVADYVRMESEGFPSLGFSPKAHLARLGDLTRQAKEALRTNAPEELGHLMTEAHGYLVELGVSDPRLNHLVDTACQAGALGAKLTGGGRGGCMIALAATKQAAQDLCQILEEAGAKQTWMQCLGSEGEKR